VARCAGPGAVATALLHDANGPLITSMRTVGNKVGWSGIRWLQAWWSLFGFGG